MTHHRAQRLPSTSLPGELLKRAFDTTRKLKLKDVGERDPVYLEQIREMPCLKCGMEPCGEAAHVRFASAAFHKRSGTGKTPPDKFAVPLCRACHLTDRDAQHNMMERAFWNMLGLNPLLVAERLYAARGNLVTMRAVIMVAIASRQSSNVVF
jgi:hypothetical protein